MVIRDEKQRSWNLRLDRYGPGVYIAEGWRKFSVDNDLKKGDFMMFEVVANEEKPIWKFHGKFSHLSNLLFPTILLLGFDIKLHLL